jgi:hypothetical protein
VPDVRQPQKQRNAYGRHGEKVNAYGIGVSKAQGVVDGLTGGRLLSGTRVYSHQ